MKNAFFIVSTGRTGTQAIAHSIERLEPDHFFSVHEPAPSRIFRLLSNARMAGVLPEAVARRVLHSLRDPLIRKVGGRTLVESNNFLFGLVDLLAREYDGVIVHIVRHPADYAESHLKHGAFRGIKGMAGRFFPYWLARPRFRGYRARASWLEMSQHERLFWVWRLVNEYIEELGRREPSRYRLIKFEDLFTDISVYDELLRAMGVSADSVEQLNEEMRHRANRGRGEAAPLSTEDRRKMREICGSLASHYGYQL